MSLCVSAWKRNENCKHTITPYIYAQIDHLPQNKNTVHSLSYIIHAMRYARATTAADNENAGKSEHTHTHKNNLPHSFVIAENLLQKQHKIGSTFKMLQVYIAGDAIMDICQFEIIDGVITLCHQKAKTFAIEMFIIF